MESSLFPIDSPRRRPSTTGGTESEYGLLGQGRGDPEVHPGNAPAGAGRGSQPATPARHHSHREDRHPVAAAAIAFLLITAPAAAQTPNQKAEAEARSFLIKCAFPDDRQFSCLIHQRNFIEMYVYAKAGDLSGIGSTADSFQPSKADAPGYMTEMDIGMPVSPLQSCAWWIVRASAPLRDSQRKEGPMLQQLFRNGRIQLANDICAHLSDDDRVAARRRAEVLIKELHTTPAQMPPDTWEPTVR